MPRYINPEIVDTSSTFRHREQHEFKLLHQSSMAGININQYECDCGAKKQTYEVMGKEYASIEDLLNNNPIK